MNLPMPAAIGIWVLIGLGLLALIWTGRRRQSRRLLGTVPAPPAAPTDLGAVVMAPVQAVYVSSTVAGDWLARVGAHQLGDRSTARVGVWDAGVLIVRQGAPEVFIPAAAIEGVALTPAMAGKVTGKENIVVITWTVPAVPLIEPGSQPAPLVPPTRLDTGIVPRHKSDVALLLQSVDAFVSDSETTDQEDGS